MFKCRGAVKPGPSSQQFSFTSLLTSGGEFWEARIRGCPSLAASLIRQLPLQFIPDFFFLFLFYILGHTWQSTQKSLLAGVGLDTLNILFWNLFFWDWGIPNNAQGLFPELFQDAGVCMA